MSLPTEWTGVQSWLIALSFALITALYNLLFRRSHVKTVLRRMPWKIAPFLIGLSIIVEAMASSGWTNLLATQILQIISKEVFIRTFELSLISALGASLMNNHVMSFFFVKTIKESLVLQFSKPVQVSSTFALVIGSNLGANYMLTGSLAGLMWSKILSDKGVKISFHEFSKYGFIIMPLVTLTASLSLAMILTFNFFVQI